MIEWFQENQSVVWWLVAVSLVTFVGSLIAVPIVVARLPADYFVRAPSPEPRRHPVIHAALIGLKNLVGVMLVLAGLIMSIPPIPGQGILTILLGLSLLDFPGKRALQLRTIRFGPVRKSLEWIRAKAAKPPLQIPEPGIRS